MAAESRASAERAMRAEVIGCQRCLALAEGRTQVVFGSGSVDAQLMFVGEAPGATEDREGLPFIGASGKLLDQLLATIAMTSTSRMLSSAGPPIIATRARMKLPTAVSISVARSTS